MKKRIVLSGLLAAALTLSLTACGGDKMPEETPVPTPIQTSTPVPTPTPTPAPAAPKWGDQVFAKTFTSGDGATVLTASFTLPLIQNTDACPAGAAINEWYKAEGASRMLEAEEAYEMAAGSPFYPTTQEMTYQIAYADEKVISVCRDLYVSSEGEAHPAVFLLSEQFDAVMGEKLDFTDFFTDADAVRARVVDALLDQRSELAAAVEQGTLTRDAITAAVQVDNFYCTAEGYVFWLQGGALPAMNSPLSAVLTYGAMKDVSVNG